MSWSLQIGLVVFSQHRELKPFRSQTYNSLNHVPYFYYNFGSENFEFHQPYTLDVFSIFSSLCIVKMYQYCRELFSFGHKESREHEILCRF